VFLKWAAHANEYAKEEKEKNTTFSANFHGALLNVTGIDYSLMRFYNNIPRVLLYREGCFAKKIFKGGF